MCLRKLAVNLWSSSDIVASIWKIEAFTYVTEDWREICEDRMKEKVTKLELPKALTKQMIDIVHPIGTEIRRWKMILKNSFSVSSASPAKIYFTATGLINYQKTVEELLRCDKLDVVQRYDLACAFCMEDYISVLWEELPETKKEVYGDKNNMSPELSFCWPHILKKEPSKLDSLLRSSDRNLTSFNQYAFEYSVIRFNKTAAEYFLQKLTTDERKVSLMRTATAVVTWTWTTWISFNFPLENTSTVFFYLLSLMPPEQKMKIFKDHPIEIAVRFLDWPWQVLFLENVELLWTFLRPKNYVWLLYEMAFKLWYSDRYSAKLFRDFFIQSPAKLKKCFAGQDSMNARYLADRFVFIFFKFEDKECIELIFRNVDAGDGAKIVFRSSILHLLYKNIMIYKWRLVKVCLREAMLSKNDRKKLKTAFMELIITLGRLSNRKFLVDKLEKFFKFLGETGSGKIVKSAAQSNKLC
ncbi:unnamed protein product [Larinioides sclopetarius]